MIIVIIIIMVVVPKVRLDVEEKDTVCNWVAPLKALAPRWW